MSVINLKKVSLSLNKTEIIKDITFSLNKKKLFQL